MSWCSWPSLSPSASSRPLSFFTRHRDETFSGRPHRRASLPISRRSPFSYISAISPIEQGVNQLTKQVPIWRKEIASGKGTVGHLARQLHLSDYLGGTSTGSLAEDLASGALGAGKLVLSAVSSNS